jgi:hypothetical protein
VSWAFLVAGCLALMGSAIHGGVGDAIVRRIDDEKLPGNPFAGISTKLLIRVTWHFVTIAFFVLGVALVWIGVTPHGSEVRGVAYVAGACFFCWAVFTLTAGFRRGGGLRAFRAHPGPIVFVLTVILIAWGTAQL